MQLTLPLTEALAVARGSGRVPPFVVDLAPTADGVAVRVDLSRMPEASSALRWAAALAGPVDVVVRYTGLVDGTATFAVTSRARAVPLHVLVNSLTSTATSVLRQRGLGDLVEVRRGEEEPVVAVRVQHAIDQRAPGARLTALELRDGVAHLTLDITGLRVS
ncbi:hypothetical protein [Cellulomonas marina]|uniref:Uncharacterized protein n=1 Tax=Cellulomonas marina TaxID=988821 RepID=A0A1I0V3S1_9CELL|nr:hypothetical protein [Cellulomonas marina]GIG28313.1 hypothetical protein Cma02nite_09130 [Cellulomonas marina]SFA70975.1 hypothetical protein SAMN05421867_101140 [Cellulomonas marina]